MRPFVFLLLVASLAIAVAQGAVIVEKRSASSVQRLKNAQRCHDQLIHLSLRNFCRAWLHGTQPSQGGTQTTTVTVSAPTQSTTTTNTISTIFTTAVLVPPNNKRGSNNIPKSLRQLNFPSNVITDGCLLLLYGTLSYPQQVQSVTTTTTPSATKTIQTTSTAVYPSDFVVRLGSQYAILGASVFPTPSVSGNYQVFRLIDVGQTTDTSHTGVIFNDYNNYNVTFAVDVRNPGYGILQTLPEYVYGLYSYYKKLQCSTLAASEQISTAAYRGNLTCSFDTYDTFANVVYGQYTILTTRDYCSSDASKAALPAGGCVNWDSVQWEAGNYALKP